MKGDPAPFPSRDHMGFYSLEREYLTQPSSRIFLRGGGIVKEGPVDEFGEEL